MLDQKANKTSEFDAQQYLEHIAERVSDHSFVKLPYIKAKGFPDGIYRVGPLARLNVMKKISGALTQDYLSSYVRVFGKPSDDLTAYNMARVIELINAVESIQKLLNQEKVTSTNVRDPVKERKGTGVGIVEAPRGILIHNYQTNNDGIITNANVISPTTQNAPSIERDLQKMAEQNLEELIRPENHESQWKMETLVRAYDPCISCATHLVKVIHE